MTPDIPAQAAAVAKEILWRRAQRPDEDGRPRWREDEHDAYFTFPDVQDDVAVLTAALLDFAARGLEETDAELVGRALHDECVAYNMRHASRRYDDRSWEQITEGHRASHRGEAAHVLTRLRARAAEVRGGEATTNRRPCP